MYSNPFSYKFYDEFDIQTPDLTHFLKFIALRKKNFPFV